MTTANETGTHDEPAGRRPPQWIADRLASERAARGESSEPFDADAPMPEPSEPFDADAPMPEPSDAAHELDGAGLGADLGALVGEQIEAGRLEYERGAPDAHRAPPPDLRPIDAPEVETSTAARDVGDVLAMWGREGPRGAARPRAHGPRRARRGDRWRARVRDAVVHPRRARRGQDGSSRVRLPSSGGR